MSLYSGIKLSIPVESDNSEATPRLSSSKQNGQAPQSPAPNETMSATSVDPVPVSKPKAAGEWSAALKFAPRIPKPKGAPSRPPLPGPSTSSPGTSTPPIESNLNTAGTSGSTYKPDIVRSAEPQVYVAKDEVVLGADGKPLARAPAMTLHAGKKGKGMLQHGKRGQEVDSKKKKKKKKRKNQAPVLPTFDPDEQYDPYKPNDLGEYQYYRKKLREERRAQLLEDKRRKAAGESSEGSSYYTDSEEEAPRRDAPKLFAPPKQYSPPPSARPPSPPLLSAPPPPSGSGDDAYARRAAMASASTDDDPYARRAAMSQTSTGDDAYSKRAATSQAGTGDDAYARRAAMSASPPPSDPRPPMPTAPPPFVPPPAHLSAGAPVLPPPTSGIPGSGSFSQPPPLPFSTYQPPQSSAPASGSGGDFASMLEERKKAAQAIAAKLQALGMPTQAPAPVAVTRPSEDTDTSGTFAEKMFRKWGHVEGSGLGARGEGIKHALAAEHVEAPPKSDQPLSKRQIAKQQAAAANAKNKNRKWVQHATSRGKIVNTNEDELAKAEHSRLGEASRIICLVGLVNGVDEVDEELSDEIGEEASKHGIVERVVLHMVEPPPEDPRECLRVFIVFSGMAGAWRATKELDGRFFGGKRISVTYFDETKFDAGDRDGPIARG